MNNTEIFDKIRDLTNKQIEEKRKKEEEALTVSLNKDKEKVEKVLRLINDNLLYKKVEIDSFTRKVRYVMVTPDIFLEDYIIPPKQSYYNEGIRFIESTEYWRGICEVNGNTYYDIRRILHDYEKSVDKCKQQLSYYSDHVKECEKTLNDLYENIPEIKKLVLNFNEFLKEHPENIIYY